MKDETLFFHGESVDKRRFTIAARFIAESADLLLGIAICGKGDQFVKKIGRDKAEGRLMSEGFKGCSIASLYSTRFFKEYQTGLAGFPENYFTGKELEVFIGLCKKFQEFTFKELRDEFNLDY